MAPSKGGRKGNPDALKAYRETKRQREEEQQTAAATGVQMEDTELTGAFASLATALRQAQQERSADEAVKVISDAMTKLDDDALSRITSSPIVQALIEKAATKGTDPLPPRSYIRDNQGRVMAKGPWSAQDILDTYPMITFTPAHTIPVPFNGHTVK